MLNVNKLIIHALAFSIFFCGLHQRSSAGYISAPQYGGKAGDNDPFWFYLGAAALVGIILLIPGDTQVPSTPAPQGGTKTINVKTEAGQTSTVVPLPPGGSVTTTITLNGNGSVASVSNTTSQGNSGATSSLNNSSSGSGSVSRPGTFSSGSDTLLATQGSTALAAFSRVRVDLSFALLQLGTLVIGSNVSPDRSAFSSESMSATLTVPGTNLNIPLFSGSASLNETPGSSTFSSSGDFANAFTVGPGILPDGEAGILATAQNLTLSGTIDLPASLPAGTTALVNFQFTGMGSASIVPEPPSFLTFGVGMLGLLAGYGWHKHTSTRLAT
jgi:hypothetical protein